MLSSVLYYSIIVYLVGSIVSYTKHNINNQGDVKLLSLLDYRNCTYIMKSYIYIYIYIYIEREREREIKQNVGFEQQGGSAI